MEWDSALEHEIYRYNTMTTKSMLIRITRMNNPLKLAALYHLYSTNNYSTLVLHAIEHRIISLFNKDPRDLVREHCPYIGYLPCSESKPVTKKEPPITVAVKIKTRRIFVNKGGE